MRFPKNDAENAPDGVIRLAERLVPLLIEGEHPALLALRQQFPRARVKEVELTGHGFYVNFEVPPDVPLTEPTDFAGGDARLTVQGIKNRAECVLFIRGAFGNARRLYIW